MPRPSGGRSDSPVAAGVPAALYKGRPGQPVGGLGLGAGLGSTSSTELEREALAVDPDSPVALTVARKDSLPAKEAEERSSTL